MLCWKIKIILLPKNWLHWNKIYWSKWQREMEEVADLLQQLKSRKSFCVCVWARVSDSKMSTMGSHQKFVAVFDDELELIQRKDHTKLRSNSRYFQICWNQFQRHEFKKFEFSIPRAISYHRHSNRTTNKRLMLRIFSSCLVYPNPCIILAHYEFTHLLCFNHPRKLLSTNFSANQHAWLIIIIIIAHPKPINKHQRKRIADSCIDCLFVMLNMAN